MDFLKDLFHSFIPNSENDYKPHFFRVRAVLTTAVVILILAGGALTVQTAIRSNFDYIAAVVASALVDLTNGDRSANGFPRLALNPVLQRVAELKAADMAAKSYFAHNSPDGITPWHWFGEAGYDFAYAGENLATYFSDSADVARAWMNSPGHRANILNEHFTEIGIATAEGTYNGVPTVFVVQMFGTPAARLSTPVATETPATKIETPDTAPSQVAGTSTAPTLEPATTTPEQPATVSPPKVTVTSVSKPASTTSPIIILGSTAEEFTLPEVDPFTKVLVANDNFIAVQKTVATNSPLAFAAGSGTSVSLVQQIVTSPQSSVETVLFALAALIALALALMIGICLLYTSPSPRD